MRVPDLHKASRLMQMMDMAVSALPILLVVPLFDILMYFNMLPKSLAVLVALSYTPSLNHFGVEMMFLGNT